MSAQSPAQPALFNTLYAWKCKGTHHKLAMDALRHLRNPDREDWTRLFLSNIENFLEGAKAPDDKFKDFKNHVLHVGEGEWGGAVATARLWYDRTVIALREQSWPTAVYAAGILSHYYTDPIQPFHTGQSEAEQVVHRAAEWSISKSYDVLRTMLEAELGGYPDVAVPAGADWLEQMVRQGARTAHPHYQFCIDHYDFARGVKNPPAGMDRPLQECIARLLGHATVGYARILDRAFEEANSPPPATGLTLMSVLARLTVPLCWVTKQMANADERALVTAMYREFQKTGKVIDTATEDDRTLRKLHAEEVLKVPLDQLDAQPAGPLGSQFVAPEPVVVEKPVVEKPAKKSKPAKPEPAPAPEPADHDAGDVTYFLELDSPLEDAPSIGPKTAARFDIINVKTVGEFLDLQPESAAKKLAVKHLDAKTLREWQAQARLVLRIPGLRGHDAQLLVAAGVQKVEDLVALEPADIHELVLTIAATPEGDRILRDSAPPDLEEVIDWTTAAKSARAA